MTINGLCVHDRTVVQNRTRPLEMSRESDNAWQQRPCMRATDEMWNDACMHACTFGKCAGVGGFVEWGVWGGTVVSNFGI